MHQAVLQPLEACQMESPVTAGGGVLAAAGFRYQYLRTIEALLDLFEGRAANDVLTTEDEAGDAIDYSVRDVGGAFRVVSQVKHSFNVAGSRRMTRPELMAIALRLTEVDSPRYLIQMNGELYAPAAELAQIFALPQNSAVKAKKLAALPELCDVSVSSDLQARLARCEVMIDDRSSKQTYEDVRERIRGLRSAARQGLGDTSSRLLVNHLISEVFERSADSSAGNRFTLDDFRRLIYLPELEIARSAGTYDWGMPIGQLPPRPTVDRWALMRDVASRLHKPLRLRAPGYCAVVGLSGLGKSSIAAAYAHEFAASYDWILWIDCETDQTLRRSMQSMAAVMSSSEEQAAFVGLTDADLAQRCAGLLARSVGTWLVVFDGASSAEQIRPWLPSIGRIDVLATSTNTQPWAGWGIVQMSEMSLPEARELVVDRLSLGEELTPAVETSISEILKATDRWPLALDLACAYLAQTGRGIAVTTSYLKAVGDRIYRMQDLLPGYPRSLVGVIELALADLPTQTALGVGPQEVLEAVSFLPATGVPMRTAIQAALVRVSDREHQFDGILSQPSVLDVDDMFRLLRARGLIRRHTEVESPSPAVQDQIVTNEVLLLVLRRRLSTVEEAYEIVAANFDAYSLIVLESRDQQDFHFLNCLVPISFTLIQYALDLGLMTQAGLLLMGNLGETLINLHDYATAARALQLELTFLDALGMDVPILRAKIHSALADCAVNLNAPVSDVYSQVGRALDALERIGDLQSEPDVAWLGLRLDDIVQVLRRSGRADGAELLSMIDRVERAARRLRESGTPGEVEALTLLRRLDDDDDLHTIELIERKLSEASLSPVVVAQLRAALVEAYATVSDIERAQASMHAFFGVCSASGLPRSTGAGQLGNAVWQLVSHSIRGVTGEDGYSLAVRLLDELDAEETEASPTDYESYRRRVLRACLAAVHAPTGEARRLVDLIGLEPNLPWSYRDTGLVTSVREGCSAILQAREEASGAALCFPRGFRIRRHVDAVSTRLAGVSIFLNVTDVRPFGLDRCVTHASWSGTPFGIGIRLVGGLLPLPLIWIPAAEDAGAYRFRRLANELVPAVAVSLTLVGDSEDLWGPVPARKVSQLSRWRPDRLFGSLNEEPPADWHG